MNEMNVFELLVHHVLLVLPVHLRSLIHLLLYFLHVLNKSYYRQNPRLSALEIYYLRRNRLCAGLVITHAVCGIWWD